ncbi:MAG: hypothetical protein KKD01_02955 [Proteobacteria bacterium]|nr:hypothetical protein [Pseudomonadota bacterium]MBU1417785.1 hypothetical protein [Pseudomonadota bacterium]MBU1453661.1 hypothetical protein [Pseudomonadota bacterium]
MHEQQKTGSVIRLRAIVTGIVLAVSICLLTPFNNIYQQATPLGGGHFPLAPFFIFLLLTILIAITTKLFRSRSPFLSGNELLIIWIEMVIGSGIAYTGLARTLLLNLTAPIHFASVSNQWEKSLHSILPSGITPSDSGAIEMLYTGLPGGRDMNWLEVASAIPWQPWLTPLMLWGCFILLSYCFMLFVINLLSRQWIHNERINFPLLRVPEMLSRSLDDGKLGSFFSNRFLLAGLLLPIGLHFLNGFHFYYPSVPQLPTLILAGPYFPDHGLFSGFQKLKIYIYPAFIGFAFLTSRQISFSFWFFFILGGLLFGILGLLGYTIPASELGITFGPTLARPEETQMIGAYGIFFFFLLWLARAHLMEVTRESLFLVKPSKSRTEWFDVRLSFWGSIFCFGALLFWATWLGMSLTTAFFFLCVAFMIMLVATRIICQGGLAYFTLPAAPMDVLLATGGTKLFSGVNGLICGMAQKALFVDLRESLMPSLLHARKLSHGSSTGLLIFSGLFFTILASLVASILAMMTLYYRYGIRELQMEWASRTTVTVFENVHRLLTAPTETGSWITFFAITGAVIMLILVICYHRFYWWPIHPLGYLTAYSSAMRILWVSFFVGWACNALCMRYGGVSLFKKVQFFFIGLIIGDFLMGGGWAIVGLFTDSGYQVLPD